jgi:hypothetical protein
LQFRHFLLTAISLILLAPAYLPAETTQHGEEFVEERRLRLWSAQTKNRDLVYSTYLRIDQLEGTDPGSWVYEWSNIAKYFADRGEEFAKKEANEAARNAFLSAAKFYGIARFPAKTLPGQLDAYSKHLQYYKRAGEYFDPELIVLDIPFDGKSIQGYLHRPADVEKPPLILWNGGIDTWKGDSYNNIQPYIERGFAVLTFDVLGTGENSGWAAEPDSNKLRSRYRRKLRLGGRARFEQASQRRHRSHADPPVNRWPIHCPCRFQFFRLLCGTQCHNRTQTVRGHFGLRPDSRRLEQYL